MADVEPCTAREWIRIGRQLNELPVIAGEFAAGRLSFAKVRTLTRVATADNETELAALARTVPASGLALRWRGGATATTQEPRSTPTTISTARCGGGPTPTGW